jgi:hypothetical protein
VSGRLLIEDIGVSTDAAPKIEPFLKKIKIAEYEQNL